MWLLPADVPGAADNSSALPQAAGVADVVAQALATLAPTSGPARTAARVVITRHAATAPTRALSIPAQRLCEPPIYGVPIAVRSGPAVSTAAPPGDADPVLHVGPDPADATAAPAAVAATASAAGWERRDEPGNVGLLVLDATATAATPTGLDQFIGNAARVLAPGGVLAAITISHHRGGVLHDPRPALITSARAASLDYWQHIVTTTRPEHPHRHDDPPADGHHESGQGGARRKEWRLVAEVSVFRRPSPGRGLGGAVGSGRPGEPTDIGECPEHEQAQPGKTTTMEVQP